MRPFHGRRIIRPAHLGGGARQDGRMSGPTVVVGYGDAYPESVIDQLASEIEACGVVARLELLGPDARIVVELPADDALLTGPVRALWDAVVATAQRRHRRQLAEGRPREV